MSKLPESPWHLVRTHYATQDRLQGVSSISLHGTVALQYWPFCVQCGEERSKVFDIVTQQCTQCNTAWGMEQVILSRSEVPKSRRHTRADAIIELAELSLLMDQARKIHPQGVLAFYWYYGARVGGYRKVASMGREHAPALGRWNKSTIPELIRGGRDALQQVLDSKRETE